MIELGSRWAHTTSAELDQTYASTCNIAVQGTFLSRQQHSIVLREGNAEAMVDVSSPLFREVATQIEAGSYLLAIGHVAIGSVCPVIKAHKVSKFCC